MVRGLIQAGLLLVAVAVLGLIVVDTEMGGDHRLTLRTVVIGGTWLCASGLLLGFLSKTIRFIPGRRCAICRRRVRHGHVYCEDHFRAAVYRSRDSISVRGRS